MTAGESPARRRPRRRRTRLLRPLLLALALVLAFVIGIAIGQAISSQPEPGPAVTTVRTIVPMTATDETMTVTTAPGAP